MTAILLTLLTLGQLRQRKPVAPCMIVSIGPPLLHATTGFWYCIASSGTMPKCSLSGVYKRHVQFERSAFFCSLFIELKNTTLSFRCNSCASLQRKVMQERQKRSLSTLLQFIQHLYIISYTWIITASYN